MLWEAIDSKTSEQTTKSAATMLLLADIIGTVLARIAVVLKSLRLLLYNKMADEWIAFPPPT
jgi:hypothetical protein